MFNVNKKRKVEEMNRKCGRITNLLLIPSGVVVRARARTFSAPVVYRYLHIVAQPKSRTCGNKLYHMVDITTPLTANLSAALNKHKPDWRSR